jgi:hypothetical protein
MSFIRPQPIDHEIILDETKIIMSKTDKRALLNMLINIL